MLKPKIPTTISKLVIGDYFIPEGENTVYQFNGYDPDWELWEAFDDLDSTIVMFDDMKYVWMPCYEWSD